MKKKIISRAVRKIIYILLIMILPTLLKIRAGITYKESKTISKFYLHAAFYRRHYLKAVKVFFLLFFKVDWKNFLPDYSLFNEKYYAEKETNHYIGNWYSISPQTFEKSIVKPDLQNMKFFSIGREAIFHVLDSNEFDKKVAVLPNFTCFTVLDPFLQDGWELHFYRYNKDLSVDAEYFYELFKKTNPSVCIFQSLSGMGFLDAENTLIDYAHKNGCMTIVDQTQDIYGSKDNSSVDYYCASLRKWYPFPDGAYAYSSKYNIDKRDDLEENNTYRTSMGLCMFARYLKNVYKDPFFGYLYYFMWTFSVSYIGSLPIKAHTMSDYSRSILSQQDEKLNSDRRIKNFNYIYQGIQGLNTIKPAFADIKRLTSVPLSFPVYVKNRASFCEFLSTNKIYTQLLWEKPKYIKNNIALDETSEYIYNHILSLPCDQQYDLNDMQKLVDVICEYDRKQY